MIRFLDKNDTEYIKQAKALWKKTFHDSDGFIEYYYKLYFHDNDFLLCWIEESRIISMLHTYPVSEGNLYAKLVAGVATDETYRNKGYARRLFEYLHSSDRSMSYIVQPQNDDLWKFYEKLGYKQLCTYYLLEHKNANINAAKKRIPPLLFLLDTLDDYKSSFDTALCKDILLTTYEASVGEGFFAYTDRAYAFCTEDGDTCRAMYVVGEYTNALLDDICAQTACPNIEILLAKPEKGAKPVPFNMIHTDRDTKTLGSIFSNLYY